VSQRPVIQRLAWLAAVLSVMVAMLTTIPAKPALALTAGDIVFVTDRWDGYGEICKNLELFNTYRGTATWQGGINHCSFSFSAGTVPDNFSATIYLDFKGRPLEEKEVLDELWSKAVDEPLA
jgi:hypothetical protein